MQFQIECNNLKSNQLCITCEQLFEMSDARLIVRSTQGDSYGDVCPECISKGAIWIKSQLQNFNHQLSYKMQ